LQRRLASDRRCFAFFHPTLPDEPLIFVQVALVKGISRSVTPLLEEESPILQVKEADTAIFYSISTCEEGLRGVTLGNFLIKRVVALLKDELPHIKSFSTLSPVPGLRRWIDEAAARHELATIRDKAAEALGMLEQDDWQQDETARERWLELCAHYLIREKRGAMNRMPLDPVARFHLGNGARLERINWQGDLSENGMAQSAGILVNYLYDEGAIEHNHEALINTGEVAHSGPVRKLLPALPKSQDKEAARSEAKSAESASAA
jgi:malonyl-CoA decarboxylase